ARLPSRRMEGSRGSGDASAIRNLSSCTRAQIMRAHATHDRLKTATRRARAPERLLPAIVVTPTETTPGTAGSPTRSGVRSPAPAVLAAAAAHHPSTHAPPCPGVPASDPSRGTVGHTVNRHAVAEYR